MAASRSSAEVLVVGAGVVGLSIALALRTRGARVVVLERAGVAEGQSGIQPGGIRLQWGTTLNCRLAIESRAWWTTAGERLDATGTLALDSRGYLFVAHSEAVLERLAAAVRLQNAAGVPSRVVSPAEAGRLVPGLRTESLAGATYCAEDGYMDETRAAIAAIARQLDVRHATVDAVLPDGGAWTLDTTAGRLNAPSGVGRARRHT